MWWNGLEGGSFVVVIVFVNGQLVAFFLLEIVIPLPNKG